MTEESMTRRWLTAGLIVAGLGMGAFAGTGAALADDSADNSPSVSAAATDGQDPPASDTPSTLPPGIRISQRTLTNLAEGREMQHLRLQMMMDRRSKLLSTLSNVLKKSSDTAQNITGNIK